VLLQGGKAEKVNRCRKSFTSETSRGRGPNWVEERQNFDTGEDFLTKKEGEQGEAPITRGGPISVGNRLKKSHTLEKLGRRNIVTFVSSSRYIPHGWRRGGNASNSRLREGKKDMGPKIAGRREGEGARGSTISRMSFEDP